MATRGMTTSEDLAKQVKSIAPDGRFYSRRHSVGEWLLITSPSTSTTTTLILTGSSTTYNKRGFYVAGGEFEYWRTRNIDEGPPSGHTLIDITIIGQESI